MVCGEIGTDRTNYMHGRTNIRVRVDLIDSLRYICKSIGSGK